ncbi:related to epoxide hydrolase [Armillaria ostoyae]|uniref:Related to epoxide hydrolase n=1 Tax=Armillaria ostoyae TaxID=47428 RepID=A0A284REU8_ARMOS|nr:related to epoxide hydrolase [Armillaria ostoyae]
MTPQPFKIVIPDEKLHLLCQKLNLATFPDELDDSGLKYGAPLGDIRCLVFTLDIPVDGFGTLNIHFVHQMSKVLTTSTRNRASNFIEVQKLLSLLTDPSPEHPSFHVVALSLPGYGFSQAPTKQGFASAQYAEVGYKLMLALGYDAYVTQGGDWGARITRTIAVKYGGTHAKAWHTNLPLGAKPPISHPLLWLKDHLLPLTTVEKAGLEHSKMFDATGRGYFHEQVTQPQTIGYSLADSPLLAWIYEKLLNWTDEYPWGDNEDKYFLSQVEIPLNDMIVLTWVSIYLFSHAGPTASLRIYYETRQEDSAVMPKPGTLPTPNIKLSTIPMDASYFTKEIRWTPKTLVHPHTVYALVDCFASRWTEAIGNLKFVSEHACGGHFVAHEKPEELVDDLRKFFGKGGAAGGVVPRKTGF